jgi:hypothetical protein
MSVQPVYLIDEASRKIAALEVARDGDLYTGTICLDAVPPRLLHLFQEFEEFVEGQMFTLADEVEEKLAAVPLRVEFANGLDAVVEDLQVYPSTKRVSFKTRQVTPTAK